MSTMEYVWGQGAEQGQKENLNQVVLLLYGVQASLKKARAGARCQGLAGICQPLEAHMQRLDTGMEVVRQEVRGRE